jgi:hypothetical protein
VKRNIHSTGALYITICNNPRVLQYLREETILALVFPAPEPTVPHLNEALRLCVQDLKAPYNGEWFWLYRFYSSDIRIQGLNFESMDMTLRNCVTHNL